MKLKYEFVSRNVADKTVAIAVDKNPDGFNGMLTLNDSGAFIFELLKEETTVEKITTAFLKEYDATKEQAEKTITEFISKLRENDLIQE